MRLSVTGLCLALAATGVHAHRGDHVYPIFELTDAAAQLLDVHDGSVADWLTLVGEPTLGATDFSRAIDPGDLDFRIWLAWHDASDRLFVAMERTDDVYTNDYTLDHACGYGMDGFDSGLGFAVDGDHGGGLYAWGISGTVTDAQHHEWLQALQQKAQAYMAIAETFDASATLRSGMLDSQSGIWWYVRPPWADGGGARYGERPTVTVTEFYVTPMNQLDPGDATRREVCDLRANAVIGFSFFVGDVDSGPVHRACGSQLETWARLPWGSGGSADAMVDGLLLPAAAGGGGPAPPMTQDVSWARIKAAFSGADGSGRR